MAADDGTERVLEGLDVWGQSETITEMVKGEPPRPRARKNPPVPLSDTQNRGCLGGVRDLTGHADTKKAAVCGGRVSRQSVRGLLTAPVMSPGACADTDPGDIIPLASVGKDALDKTVEYMQKMAEFKQAGTSDVRDPHSMDYPPTRWT